MSAKDRLTGSTRSTRLKKFRALLENATPLRGPSLNLSKTTLIRGEKIGHMYNGTIELPGWMKSVRELASATGTDRGIHATFYFPDNEAGPDLVFALRQQSGVPILCLLQVRFFFFSLPITLRRSVTKRIVKMRRCRTRQGNQIPRSDASVPLARVKDSKRAGFLQSQTSSSDR